jgi:predicted nucleic acid-binding protein
MGSPPKRYVLDASVIVKWAIPDPAIEPHVDQALALLGQIRSGLIGVVQPPHWLAEVAAVLIRLRPSVAERATAILASLDLDVQAGFSVYQQALGLSAKLRHHLFDTLYHAVALQDPGTTLITADEAYYRKAQGEGAIIRLAAFQA